MESNRDREAVAGFLGAVIMAFKYIGVIALLAIPAYALYRLIKWLLCKD